MLAFLHERLRRLPGPSRASFRRLDTDLPFRLGKADRREYGLAFFGLTCSILPTTHIRSQNDALAVRGIEHLDKIIAISIRATDKRRLSCLPSVSMHHFKTSLRYKFAQHSFEIIE
jgi:hypothetical protein